MSVFLNIVLCSGLTLAFWQDWKFRAIHWILFILIFWSCALIAWDTDGMEWVSFMTKLFFIGMLIFSLTLYVSGRKKRLINIFKAHFGLGDLLFFLAVSPLFISPNYVLFFISGLLISALVHFLLVSLSGSLGASQEKMKTIPLAGYLAVYLLLLKAVELFSRFNPFTDPII